jgi:hypothetical protein
MKNELDCLAEALSSLRPGEPMYYNSGKPGDPIDASKIVYESNCSHITQSELDNKIAELQAAEPIRLLRIERNIRLAETDWMANKDVTLPAAWKTYRQKLRDFPATVNPTLDENGQLTNITWPTKPE